MPELVPDNSVSVGGVLLVIVVFAALVLICLAGEGGLL